MTKVEAIRQVLLDNHGVAPWEIIYNQITRHYPLAQRSSDWKAGIRGVLYREIKNGRHFKMLDIGLVSLLSYDERDLVLEADRPFLTEKNILASIRIGQERFRKKLLKTLTFCPITEIDDVRLLQASHIKPWAVSSDIERIDVNNGFMFSPAIDRLFDRGLITFDTNKRMLLSPTLEKRNVQRLGLEHGSTFRYLPSEPRELFLEFHRQSIFLEK